VLMKDAPVSGLAIVSPIIALTYIVAGVIMEVSLELALNIISTWLVLAKCRLTDVSDMFCQFVDDVEIMLMTCVELYGIAPSASLVLVTA